MKKQEHEIRDGETQARITEAGNRRSQVSSQEEARWRRCPEAHRDTVWDFREKISDHQEASGL